MIDREVSFIGYTYTNIRRITKSENSIKRDKMLVYDWRTKEASYIKLFTPEDDGTPNPF